MGRKIGAVSFLEILAPELNDRMLADILDLETGVIVNLHIRSIDQTEAIKTCLLYTSRPCSVTIRTAPARNASS